MRKGRTKGGGKRRIEGERERERERDLRKRIGAVKMES